jgi:hypothetical protein
MNFINKNIKYIILDNNYEKKNNQKSIKPKHIDNIFYYLNNYIDNITSNNENIITQQIEEPTIVEIDFNEFDAFFNEPIIIEQPNIEKKIEPIINNDISKITTKNITKNEIINYDNFTYNFKKINNENNKIKEEIKETKEINEIEEIKEIEEQEEEYDKFENNNIEEDKLFKLFQMEMMFKDVLINKQNMNNNKNLDVDVVNMDTFIDNYIIKSSIRYNIEKKMHIINIDSLIKSIKTSVNNNNCINKLFYSQNSQWFELSNINGLIKINENYKELNFCLINLKNKNKYRKKNIKYITRIIKLNYIINNNETIFYYYYKKNI